MAIWQFNIHLLPKQAILNRYDTIPEKLFINNDAWDNHLRNGNLDEGADFEDALTINWWADLKLPFKSIPFTDFGSIQDWTKNFKGSKAYGDVEASDLFVAFDEKTDEIQEISCRIDLRELDKKFINTLFLFASRFDCMLMDRKGRLFPPNFPELIGAIKLSNANRFVNDPHQFLDDLSKGIVKPE